MVCNSPRVKPDGEESVIRHLPGSFPTMSSIRFHCAICGTGLSAGAESNGSVIECPSCRHVVPVPARVRAPAAMEGLALLPHGVLALEIKFLCPDCQTKLRIDARLEGQSVTCPKCAHEIRIPHWSTAAPSRQPQPLSRMAELSEAEIEFLSGSQEMKAAQAATG